MHLISTWGTGAILAGALAGHGVIVAVVLAIVLALVAWLAFHVIAPAYEAVAAILTFVLVLLVTLLL